MFNYYVVENNTIVNIIKAHSEQIAKEVTGLECFKRTNDNLNLNIGWVLIDGTWTDPATQQ